MQRMAAGPQDLDLEGLQITLRTQRYGRSVSFYEQTGSTNDDARADAACGAPSGHVVIAEAQTAGRGSRGRSWQSPAGTDLYLSIVDRLPLALSELPPLTLAVGLAVAEAVDALLHSDRNQAAQVKWPNDVLLAGRKCAGILVETSTGLPHGDCVVIGIGLNVNRAGFAPELADVATSLRLQRDSGRPLNRGRALRVLLECVERRVDAFVADGAAATVEALTGRLSLLGQPARCDGRQGVVRGVAPSGALLFESARGLETIVAGRLTPP